MTRDDKARARYIGQIIAQDDSANMAAGLNANNSFEAQAQADAEFARGSRRQGIPTDSPWYESILEMFRF